MLLVNEYVGERIGLHEALVLQQLLYWQKKRGDHGWIYNSYKDWQKQFRFWSLKSIQRAFLSLEKQGLLKCKRARSCNFYQLCIDTVNKVLLDADAAKSNSEHTVTENITSTSSKQVVPQIEHTQAINVESELKQMLDVWQQKIPTSGHSLILTDERKARLATLFADTFNSSLQQWSEFVDSITKSDFLMGKVTKFKATIDWAITPDVCVKILEGAYTNKNAQPKANKIMPVELEASANKSIEQIDDSRWQAAAKLLTQVLGHAIYISWIANLKFIKYENKRIYLEAESKFKIDWVDSHYRHKIIQAWHDATGKNANTLKIVAKSSAKIES